MTEERKTKVFWSADEKALLCREAARLLYTLTATGRLAALKQAQEVLPENRRRRIITLTGLDWFVEGVQLALEDLRSSVAEDVSQPPPPTLDTLSLDELYPLVRKRLVTELASFLTDVLNEVQWPSGMPAPAAEVSSAGGALIRNVLKGIGIPEPSPRPTVKIRSVLVVGLRGGQMEEIRRECGKRLDLRFVGADESKDRLKSMAEQADCAVAMTDFISHSHEDILTKRARKYVRSSGGLTRLKELLHGLETSPELAAA